MTIDPGVVQQLIEIINKTYLDRVEQIVAAETRPAPGFEGEDIFVIALDGRKKLAIRLNETRPAGDQIAIKLLNAAEIDPGAEDEPEAAFSLSDAWPGDVAVDPLEGWVAELRATGGAAVAGWLEQIQARARAAGSLEEFAGELDALYGALAPGEFEAALKVAMEAAYGAGWLMSGEVE